MTTVELQEVIAKFDDAFYGEVFGRKAFTARIIHKQKEYQVQHTYAERESKSAIHWAAARQRINLVRNFLELVTPPDVKELQLTLAKLSREEKAEWL
jgi:hypothetical protein